MEEIQKRQAPRSIHYEHYGNGSIKIKLEAGVFDLIDCATRLLIEAEKNIGEELVEHHLAFALSILREKAESKEARYEKKENEKNPK